MAPIYPLSLAYQLGNIVKTGKPPPNFPEQFAKKQSYRLSWLTVWKSLIINKHWTVIGFPLICW